jgi:gas vesicle protein
MTDYENYNEYEAEGRSAWGIGITMLLVGLGAGALAGLLLAPRAGRQTRKLLRRKYEDTMETLNEQAEELRERGSEWVEKAKDLAGAVGEQAEFASGKVRDLGREVRKRTRS